MDTDIKKDLIDFLRQHCVNTSRKQPDKAHPLANKVAPTHCQKPDYTLALHTQSIPPINRRGPLLSLSRSFPSSRLSSFTAFSPSECTHAHIHPPLRTDWNDNEPLLPLSIDQTTWNQCTIRLNLGGAPCNIGTYRSDGVTITPE